MQKNNGSSPTKWWQRGKRPDYRFSLANERTFLAWIRTALALLAGAVGIQQLTSHTDSYLASYLLPSMLTLGAIALGSMAWRRWKQNEKAMRHDDDLSYSKLLPILSVWLLAIAVVIMYMIFMA
ncbi:YidH family protein [Edwardsiella anguillarum]|uniref:YidH family protein n=1 Tax=Edwardsiella TaxID=635 RepID=UPI00045CB4B3|nr:DUF202 domain-containing protein [Edwardsiella anguillarum]GAJ67275.1 hypothetical protein MA13_contig00005-0055 [Edwardsiella piscicida]RFT04651.1 DUF202 domain-containing protein [Edwardsiella anguillarum]WHP79648.1 DUF202 domain-containing protein [Edwardsiella anguillarum]WHQ17107.1 DUF202 domain-containing protein [Edwardsiella anguillarum]WHQ20643.1 DUF202 domain-containing protein [Edwardsiella anguillarum]